MANFNFVAYIKSHTGWTHALLVGLLGLGGVAQLPFGQSMLHSITEHHPRLTPIITTLVAIGFLLFNPKVQAKIQSVTGIDLSVDEAKLQQSKENIQQVQQDLAQAKGEVAQAKQQATAATGTAAAQTPSTVTPPPKK